MVIILESGVQAGEAPSIDTVVFHLDTSAFLGPLFIQL